MPASEFIDTAIKAAIGSGLTLAIQVLKDWSQKRSKTRSYLAELNVASAQIGTYYKQIDDLRAASVLAEKETGYPHASVITPIVVSIDLNHLNRIRQDLKAFNPPVSLMAALNILYDLLHDLNILTTQIRTELSATNRILGAGSQIRQNIAHLKLRVFNTRCDETIMDAANKVFAEQQKLLALPWLKKELNLTA